MPVPICVHYAQLEARRGASQCEPVDLCAIVPELRAMIDPQRRDKSITWTEEHQCGPCRVIADREKLVQVMLNLYSNAVKFTAPGGRGTVRARLGSEWTIVEVEDAGMGGDLTVESEVGRGVLLDSLAADRANVPNGEFLWSGDVLNAFLHQSSHESDRHLHDADRMEAELRSLSLLFWGSDAETPETAIWDSHDSLRNLGQP